MLNSITSVSLQQPYDKEINRNDNASQFEIDNLKYNLKEIKRGNELVKGFFDKNSNIPEGWSQVGEKHQAAINRFSSFRVELPENILSHKDMALAMKESLPKDIYNNIKKELSDLTIPDVGLDYKTTKKILGKLGESIHKGLGDKYNDFVFNQSDITEKFHTKNMEKGLCTPLSMLWIESKIKGGEFNVDITKTDTVEFLQWMSEDPGNNLLDYLESNGMSILPNQHEYKGGVYLLGLDNIGVSEGEKTGIGHSCAININSKEGRFEFFDPNGGQFSFKSLEKLEDFVEFHCTTQYYIDSNDFKGNCQLNSVCMKKN